MVLPASTKAPSEESLDGQRALFEKVAERFEGYLPYVAALGVQSDWVKIVGEAAAAMSSWLNYLADRLTYGRLLPLHFLFHSMRIAFGFDKPDDK